ALGRLLVVADGGEPAADPGRLDPPGDGDREDGEEQHHREEELDVAPEEWEAARAHDGDPTRAADVVPVDHHGLEHDRQGERRDGEEDAAQPERDRKSTRLNSSHVAISYAVFCLKKKITENGPK